MANGEIIKQIQQQINYLEQEKQKIDAELEAAKNYLKVLQGNYSGEFVKNEPKGNQTLEAREKMRKAQKARQERERNLRIQSIEKFLAEKKTATTEEIASHINLKINATKRCLRSCKCFQEVEINKWMYMPF